MEPKLKSLEIEFGEIKAPSKDLLEAIRKLNIKHAFPPQTNTTPLLSIEACQLLLLTQPLILRGREVIGGLRTYWFCKPQISDSHKVNALVLKSRVDRTEIVEFAQSHYLLTAISNSVLKPGPSIYAAASNNDHLKFSDNYLPLFGSNQRTVATTLGIAIKTLTSET
jgi:hypothetical protein